MDVFYTDWSGSEKKQDPEPNLAEQIRQSALDWMLNLARDDSHGYSQDNRWGPDYDCSSAIISAYKQAGVPLSCTYTGDMRQDMLRHGFQDVTSQVNRSTAAGMLPSDVLLNEVHHTAMFVGDGLEVEASINEKGGAHGGQPGDQTGREILVRAYRNNYPWDCVLRYVGNGEPVPDVPTGKPYNFTVHTVRRGSKGADVLLLQRLLRGMSFRDDDNVVLVRDGEFGEKTEQALRKFQKKYNLEVDGICGPASWGKMIGN
jgi:peptidoglycan hydrolase-like protein with peptidoglycan-binding domain